ncbi:hypothetical protein [Planomicrobium sp. YIM 101495]|nr:hypothetical protein [Planomicrobium sp. YIM 101495]
MIEYGEPLHIYGLIFFSALIIFLLGMQVGSVLKNDNKKTD